MKRELSGIYFREKVNDHWENVCFEDCSKEKQKEIVKNKDREFVENLAIMLGEKLKEIGDTFNILNKKP